MGTIRKDRNWWGLLLDLNIDDNDIIRTIAYFGTDNVYAFSTAGTLLSVWDPQLIHLNAIATDTNGLIYLGGNDKSNPNGPGVVKTFFGDGTPAGVFVTDLPFRQVMSLKIVDIVPEPRTEIMAASFYMLVAYCFTRRKQPCAPRHACNTASSDSCVLKKGRPRRL